MSPLPLYAIAGKPEVALVLLQHRRGQPPQVVLLPSLRESGLLYILPPELLQIFIALLTFQETNGQVRASVGQVAEALHLHPDLVEERLQTLAGYTYDGAPMIFSSDLTHGVNLASGERGYALSKRVGVPINEIADPVPTEVSYRPASRDEVIALSRERYATPKAEAEAIVAEQLGITPDEPIPEGREGDAFRALLAVGVPEPEVRSLMAEFPIESIEAQLAWLPRRDARNPARFLVAAIRGDYVSPDAPRAL